MPQSGCGFKCIFSNFKISASVNDYAHAFFLRLATEIGRVMLDFYWRITNSVSQPESTQTTHKAALCVTGRCFDKLLSTKKRINSRENAKDHCPRNIILIPPQLLTEILMGHPRRPWCFVKPNKRIHIRGKVILAVQIIWNLPNWYWRWATASLQQSYH